MGKGKGMVWGRGGCGLGQGNLMVWSRESAWAMAEKVHDLWSPRYANLVLAVGNGIQARLC